METIGSQKIWSFLDGDDGLVEASNQKVRNGMGFWVNSYLDLAKRVAELQYRNRDFVMLSRGQGSDYKNKSRNSTLRPRLFRLKERGARKVDITDKRFDKLMRAERLLIEKYRSQSQRALTYIKRHRIVRWSIIQHYEICATPLLDVSQSLRISASFASLEAQETAFVYVLGVPNISGAITASAEAGVEVIRLSSVCPPEAVRPHIQEGYLLSEYPELSDHTQHRNYEFHEIDFGLRLMAKFRFNPRSFWADDSFPPVPRRALYPSLDDDPIRRLAEQIRQELT